MSTAIFLSWDGDHLGRQVGLATLHDKPEELARLSVAIDRGNEIFKSWALRKLGSLVQCGGDEGTITVPADALVELPDIMKQYESAVSATVSVGIGATLSQSAKARWAAKLRGGDTAVLYNEDIEAEIAQANQGESDEAAKMQEEYGEGLGKAVSQIAPGKQTADDQWDNHATSEHDYSHILSEQHRAAGYKLEVEHRQPYEGQPGPREEITAYLLGGGGLQGSGKVLGRVQGHVRHDKMGGGQPSVEPHSSLDPRHRGKGLGMAMYEAVYAHAFHSGIRHVAGGEHSPDAAAVHMRLADKHGFDYNPEAAVNGRDEYEDGDHLTEYGPYRYALKSEPAMDEEGALLTSPSGPVFIRKAAMAKAEPYQPTLADQIRMVARKQLQAEQAKGEAAGQDADQLRQQMAKILEKLKSKVPELQQRAPGALAAVSELIAGLRELARRLPQGSLAKSEEDLLKAVDANDFHAIARALTPEGPSMVDHMPHLTAHPPQLQSDVDHYRSEVLASPMPVSTMKRGKGSLSRGVSRKAVYELAQPAAEGGEPQPARRFMVKPYHEKLTKFASTHYQKFPIQGWAEMTHQALYHSAGMGEHHSKVHVSEHPMGPGHEHEPGLVVHIDPGYAMLSSMPQGLSGGFKNPKTLEASRKIALMDFLTNNLDRHSQNMLVNRNGHLLAIDHGRSFQYAQTFADRGNGKTVAQRFNSGQYLHDTFGEYVKGTAHEKVAPFHRKPTTEEIQQNPMGAHDRARHESLENWAKTVDWWGSVSPQVRKTFDEHVQNIKDPKVRDHLRRNFHARADWLDERSRIGLENYGVGWEHDEVPMYRPGEKTDAEREEDRLTAHRANMAVG